MNTIQEKLAKIEAMQQELEAIKVTSEDRIALVTPLLAPFWDLGVHLVQIRILVPSFNDGDPCLPYLSQTFHVTLNREANREELEYYDDEGEDQIVVESMEDFLRDLGGTPSAVPVREAQSAYFRALETLLEFNKLPVQVSLTYFRNSEGVITEDEEWCESPY